MTDDSLDLSAPEQAEPELSPEQRLVQSQHIINSLRLSLQERSEEVVLIRADLTLAQAEVEQLAQMLTQVNAEVLRLKTLYEPDGVHDHGDGVAHAH
jgi:hypothetical protein